MKYSINYNRYRLVIGVLLLASSLKIAAQSQVRILPVEELFRLGTENSLQLKAARIQEVISDAHS